MQSNSRGVDASKSLSTKEQAFGNVVERPEGARERMMRERWRASPSAVVRPAIVVATADAARSIAATGRIYHLLADG